MLLYCTKINFSKKRNAYLHKINATSKERDVRDTGERVTVLEWVGTAYSSGQQEALANCTLYTDNEGNYYTDFDGALA